MFLCFKSGNDVVILEKSGNFDRASNVKSSIVILDVFGDDVVVLEVSWQFSIVASNVKSSIVILECLAILIKQVSFLSVWQFSSSK
jgi:hypothetical protein